MPHPYVKPPLGAQRRRPDSPCPLSHTAPPGCPLLSTARSPPFCQHMLAPGPQAPRGTDVSSRLCPFPSSCTLLIPPEFLFSITFPCSSFSPDKLGFVHQEAGSAHRPVASATESQRDGELGALKPNLPSSTAASWAPQGRFQDFGCVKDEPSSKVPSELAAYRPSPAPDR
ncbi:hypothetical protein Anapl_13075 [Anas platyrhynchos]|uniref:Uncharacterized protein n=1 Tax=Anas platyrhynchos TaxID=8839 RepID=R0KKY7_ANAPL|nr:hypothetical protein Anapl_13075 [Anas platyrhynchos]